MNILGIIAEYNPMHNGHVYHIKQAKELAHADYCIVIMSGSFTEQGNIAVLDKFTRAKLAIQNGADLVIELPTIYATSSAEGFAKGAVTILNSLSCITHLAFGAETDNLDALKQIATTCIKNEAEIINKTKTYLKQGITFAAAKDMALKDLLDVNCYQMLKQPNNILGIEYLKTLYALSSKIEPVLVKRLVSSHNQIKIDNSDKYASSTAIREMLSNFDIPYNERINKFKNLIPENVLNELVNNNFKTNEYIWPALKYQILQLGIEGLKNIHDVNEGFENKLYEAVATSNSYTEYIFNVKCKRYTLSRIKRICVYILLGITKELRLKLNNQNYCRILKIKKSSSQLLSILNENCTNHIITKITDKTLKELDEPLATCIKLDILTNNVVGTIHEDYTNNIIV